MIGDDDADEVTQDVFVRAWEKLRTIACRAAAPELKMDFERAIKHLPDGARQIFVLFDVEGYRHEEIAEMLNVSVGTSKSQLHRARMILREHLT
jgi:RNA polymerase sigma-70 factor (ECF subfamily)